MQSGRSNTAGYSSHAIGSISFSPAGSKAALANSYNMTGDKTRAGAFSVSRYQSSPPGVSPRSMTTPNMASSMGASSPVNAVPALAVTKTTPNLTHAKLHKRGGPGLGSAAPSGTAGPSKQFNNAIEPFPDIATPAQASPKAKVKPYLRKLSSTKDDQGRIDLSKSLAENERLANLGIKDFTTRSSTDIVYTQSSRQASHARTTSVGSQMSNSSGSYRPQPFVHPMRQAPRPYTPPTSRSRNSSPQDDEDDDAFAEDELRPGFTYRTRRSMSNSSAQVAHTPLSQTITAADLYSIPRLTNASQTNLSIVSTKSSMPNGSRRNTGRSMEMAAASPSSRTSFDRPFGQRRSDTEAHTRDERIQAARRKFQEKEAEKDRKVEKEAIKRREAEDVKEQRRQERHRRQSDASERARPLRPSTGGRTGSALGIVSSLAYEPTPATQSEKQPRLSESIGKEDKAGFFSRLFTCGGRNK